MYRSAQYVQLLLVALYGIHSVGHMPENKFKKLIIYNKEIKKYNYKN